LSVAGRDWQAIMVGFLYFNESRIKDATSYDTEDPFPTYVCGFWRADAGTDGVHGLPPVPPVAGVPAAAQQAAQKIDPERIRASVKYLADDKLEGRVRDGRRRMAAKYLADQFASYGVTPAGDNGSWYRRCRSMR